MAATSPKGSLPYGWIVKASDKYPDRVYYFNLATGATTWECPELNPPRALEHDKKVQHVSKVPHDSKEFVSKRSSIFNKSSKKPKEYRVPCTGNVSANSNKLIKTMETNNLVHSKVHVKANIPLSPENFMRTLKTKLKGSMRDTAGKSSSIPLIAKKSSPISKALSPITETFTPISKAPSPITKTFTPIVEMLTPAPLKLPLLPLPSYNLMYPMRTLLPFPEQPKTSVSNKRKLEETEQSLASIDTNPPTAVVAPVVLEKNSLKHNKASLPVIGNKKKNKRNRRMKMLKWNKIKQKKLNKVENINLLSSEIINQPSLIQARLSYGNTCMNKLSPTALKEGLVGANKRKARFSQPSATVSSSKSRNTNSSMLSGMGRSSTHPSVLSDVQSSSCDDIEMLDVSADLTKIDDLAVPAQATKDLCSYYIVIDTNVLVDDLYRIDELKDTPLNGCGPPHIFIPWIVLQELDTLKGSSRAAGSVGAAAQEAVRYLNKVLKSKHPRFHGQSPQEAENCAKSYSVNNDDKILDCCMSLAQKMPSEKVLLITHDKNLVNKALVCNINVHSWESLMEEVVQQDVEVKGLSKSKKKKKKRKSSPATPKELPESTQKNTNPKEMCKAEIHTIMSEARQLLKDVLEQFLVEEMNEAYGDPWKQFPICKNLLKGILEAITKYWRTVFAFHFADKDKRNFEILKEKVSRPEGFLGDREDCLSTLTVIEDIFCRIKRRWVKFEIPIEKVEDLRLKCNDTFTQRDSVNVTSLQVESGANLSGPASVLKAFDNAWTVINHISGMFMDFYGIDHTFRYERPELMPEEEEFRKLMIKLYPCVENIKRIMAGVVAANKNYNPRNDIYKELYRAITELVPTLGIQADNPSLPNFTSLTLEAFCRAPENVEKVRNGNYQILLFYSKLKQAKEVMYSNKSFKHPNRMALD